MGAAPPIVDTSILGGIPATEKGAAGGVATLDLGVRLPASQLTVHKSSHASGGTDPLTPADILAIPASEKGAPGGVPTLGLDSKIPSAQIPAIAITDVFPVASQAAMLALTAERGDVAVRSDISKTFILSTDSPSTLADWLEITTPFQFGYSAGSIPIGTGPNILTPLSAGALGQTLKMVESGLPAWEDRINAAREISLYEDWIGDAVGALRWLDADSGTGVSKTDGSLVDANHPGILELATGVTNGGVAARTLVGVTSGAATTGIKVGGGKIIFLWRVYIPSLATVTNDYRIDLGLVASTTLTPDQIKIQYSRATSLNWLLITQAAGVGTTIDTGIPVTSGGWILVGVEVNAAGNSVQAFVNGVAVGSPSTLNIPTAFIAPHCRIIKASAAAVSHLCYIDTFFLYQRFTTAR